MVHFSTRLKLSPHPPNGQDRRSESSNIQHWKKQSVWSAEAVGAKGRQKCDKGWTSKGHEKEETILYIKIYIAAAHKKHSATSSPMWWGDNYETLSALRSINHTYISCNIHPYWFVFIRFILKYQYSIVYMLFTIQCTPNKVNIHKRTLLVKNREKIMKDLRALLQLYYSITQRVQASAGSWDLWFTREGATTLGNLCKNNFE